MREFCELAFGEVDLDYREYVRTDERFLRPAEVDLLVGDATKARKELGWESKYTFPELVREMVQSDLAMHEEQSPAKAQRRKESPLETR